MHMDPSAGPEDELRCQCGRVGWVRAELKAEQGQGQRHLHLVHGKLLPDAVPGVKQSSSAIPRSQLSHTRTQPFLSPALGAPDSVLGSKSKGMG